MYPRKPRLCTEFTQNYAIWNTILRFPCLSIFYMLLWDNFNLTFHYVDP
jgi:hypothetical protein